MEKFKKFLFYGGLTKTEFYDIYNDIWEVNRNSLILYSFICLFGMGILYVMSLFTPVLASSRTAYIAMVVFSVIMLVLAYGPGKKNLSVIRYCEGFFTSVMLLFGILLGTVVEPNQVSASFAVLMFAAPLLFTDTPFLTDLQVFLSIVCYTILARITQTDDMFDFNMSVIIPYGIASLIISAFIMRDKIMRAYLGHENKILSEKDQLTGLYNRRSYEKKISQLEEKGINENTILCAFDINGLKNVNDTLGHNAGDELICGATDCIKAVFGKYGTCYRIGGDEFFAVIEGSAPSTEELHDELIKRTKAFHGTLVTGLSISVGMVKCSQDANVRDLVLVADKLMYRDKDAYYQRNA